MKRKQVGMWLLCAALAVPFVACGDAKEAEEATVEAVAETADEAAEEADEEETAETEAAVAEEPEEEEENELTVADGDEVVDLTLREGSENILTIVGDTDVENGSSNEVTVKMQVLSFEGELNPDLHYGIADASDAWGKEGDPGFKGDELTEGMIVDYGKLYPHAELTFNLPPGLSEMELKVVVHPLKGLNITVEHYDNYSQVPQSFYDEMNEQL